MSPEPDDILAQAWERHAQLHPVHPDERFVLENTYRIKAPGHWLVLGGMMVFLALGVIWRTPVDLGRAEILRTVLALLATLTVASGLVALRRHRLDLGRPPAVVAVEDPERPFALSALQLLFVLVCFAAMTTVLVLTAPASLVSAVVLAALFVLLIAIILGSAGGALLHAIRWRHARKTFARRHSEPDLGYFGVWDRT